MGGFDDYALADGPALGATGAVSWARHKATGQAVAVTELAAAVAADQAFLGRLRETAAALTKVGHPNVLPIREVVEGGGRVWVVEDWVDGRELGEILGDGRLTAEQSVALTDGVLRALVAVHGKGVVHGDVSTASIVVAADGVSRLVGFGFNGLPGHPAADADADVLAAAVVLRDLLAGGARHPKLEAVVARATSARPKDRPKNAAALLALVEKAARSDFGKGWEAKPSLAQRAAAPVETTEELVGPARTTRAEPLPAVPDPTADERDELDELDDLDSAVDADGLDEADGAVEEEDALDGEDGADESADLAEANVVDPGAAATEPEPDERGGPAATAIDDLGDIAEADRPEADATVADAPEPAEPGDAADDPAAAAADPTRAFELTESGHPGESTQASADDVDPAAADVDTATELEGSAAVASTEADDEPAGEEASPSAEAGGADDESPTEDPAASAEPASDSGGAGAGAEATAGASSTGKEPSATRAPAKPEPKRSQPTRSTKSRGKKHRKRPSATTPAAKATAAAAGAADTTPATAKPTAAAPAPATTPTPARGPAAKTPAGAKPAPARERRERRPPSRGVVRGLAGVIMILIGAGTAVAVDRNQSADVNQTFGPGAPFEPGDTPIGEVPTLAQIADSDITGAWNMRLAVFESTGFFGTQVGQTVQKTYTIKSDCSVTPCALKLTVTDPVGEFDLRRQGEEYVVAVSGPQDCIVLSTGAMQVPLAGVASVSVHLRPTSAIRTPRGGWSATGLSGSIVTTFDTSNPGCTQGSGVQRSTAVGTRQ